MFNRENKTTLIPKSFELHSCYLYLVIIYIYIYLDICNFFNFQFSVFQFHVENITKRV